MTALKPLGAYSSTAELYRDAQKGETAMTEHDELLAALDKQADEIAKAGLPGWGNTMLDAAAAIREGDAQLETAKESLVSAAGAATILQAQLEAERVGMLKP